MSHLMALAGCGGMVILCSGGCAYVGGGDEPWRAFDDLRSIMVWREQRAVTAALTLHYNKAMFILEPNDVSRNLARKRVTVCEYRTADWRSSMRAMSCPIVSPTRCGR